MNRAGGVALSLLLAPLLAFACNDQKASAGKVTPKMQDDEAERRSRMVETQIVARGVASVDNCHGRPGGTGVG